MEQLRMEKEQKMGMEKEQNKQTGKEQKVETEEEQLIIQAPSKQAVGSDQIYYALIIDLVQMFEINSLIVLEDEEMYQKFKKDSNFNPSVSVVYLEKISGTKEKKNRKLMQEFAIREYFADFQPLTKPFYLRKDVQPVTIIPSSLSASVLPIGKTQTATFQEEPVDGEIARLTLAVIAQNGSYEEPILGFAKIMNSLPTALVLSALADLPVIPCKIYLIS